MFNLENQAAVVTGAGNPDGLGFAIAKALLTAGARVTISATSDRILDRLKELSGFGEATALKADLSRSGEADRLIDHTVEELGRIDILVNNAGLAQTGVSSDWNLVGQITDEAWRMAQSITLDTCFFTTRAALRYMQPQSYGRIVNISSVTGPIVVFPATGGYGSAKSAMVGLTRSVAFEYGKHGITANAIAPGWIENGKSSENIRRGGLNTPLRRAGRPEEVATLALFLASRESSYVTGQLIAVDGGNTIQEFKGEPL